MRARACAVLGWTVGVLVIGAMFVVGFVATNSATDRYYDECRAVGGVPSGTIGGGIRCAR